MMEKRNVVEQKRTPEHERMRYDGDWDKQAAEAMSLKDKKASRRSKRLSTEK